MYGTPGRTRTCSFRIRSAVPFQFGHGCMAPRTGFEPVISCVTSRCVSRLHQRSVERMKGIEPSSSGWKPDALPLSYTRWAGRRESNPYLESHSLLCAPPYTTACILVRPYRIERPSLRHRGYGPAPIPLGSGRTSERIFNCQRTQKNPALSELGSENFREISFSLPGSSPPIGFVCSNPREAHATK